MKLIFCLINLFFISSIGFTQVHNRTDLSIGESVLLHSEVLEEDRIINIYLPHGYSPDSAKTYPVIYLLDGSINEDFIHIAGLVQFGSFSWINILSESIVVGISNIDRKKDFTFPSNDERDIKEFPTTGGSDLFVNFIDSELFRFVELNYNVNKEKTIIGQSLGGLLASEILYKKPEMFTNYIIISPSLWWDKYSMLNAEPKPFSEAKSIYIGVGKEGPTMKAPAKKMFKKLNKSINSQSTIEYNYFKNQNHGDILHLAVYDAFLKIFKAK